MFLMDGNGVLVLFYISVVPPDQSADITEKFHELKPIAIISCKNWCRYCFGYKFITYLITLKRIINYHSIEY